MTITDKQKAFLERNGIKISYGMSKEEASKMIDEIINKPKGEKKEEPKEVFKPKFDTSSYYVAYAKDLCCALLEQQTALIMNGTMQLDQKADVGLVMAQAILCIKQAQTEFQ